MNQCLAYFLRCALKRPFAENSCPGCHSAATREIRKKYFVTSLYHCNECGLRFRVPKDSQQFAKKFYTQLYHRDFSSTPAEFDAFHEMDCPVAEYGGNYTGYIRMLKSLQVSADELIVDYGASWGFGSWQMLQAGYRVFAYDLSEPRIKYAITKLGVAGTHRRADLPVGVSCVISAHVLEHMIDPNQMWIDASRMLVAGGWFVCFVPNGDEAYEASAGRRKYDRLWGAVHPLAITSRFVRSMCQRHGFSVTLCCPPYKEPRPQNTDEPLNAAELCFIARKL